MQALHLLHQRVFALDVVRVFHDAVRRADGDALLGIMEPDTLGALFRNDVVVVGRQSVEILSLYS